MKKRNYLQIALGLIGLYLLGIGFIYFFQHRLIFQPDVLPPAYQYAFEDPFREIYLSAKDGKKINALYFPAPGIARGAILYFHGNSDNLQRWGQYHADFTSRRYTFLAIDYRGYGKSTGEPTEQSLYEDALLAYNWLRDSFPPDQIVLYGRSLGTGVASYLATQVPARMLVLETPYDNMQDLFLTRMPALPLPFCLDTQLPTDEYLPQIPCPVYIFQGTEDDIVPLRSARRLEKHLKPGDRFIVIPEGEHKNLGTFKKYQEELDQILAVE